MHNILSYVGVTLQSELCLWTLLGLIRTIFDATLFKVNANLKQVWQMQMPDQLSMPVQRVMRTIISGVMLVQCFTVYVYLATYIVLLYPVFLEERPTLVLPWLLLAAIRKFLCELTSLALGLGACVLLGAARPPCIKFVVIKVASITPAFYMWMLVFSYYNALKVATAYKLISGTLKMMPSDHDYGLELAVRRRRTKSLQDETQLRKKLVASLNYGDRSTSSATKPLKSEITARMVHSTHADFEDIQAELQEPLPLVGLATEPVITDVGAYEDWCGTEIIAPRDTDRILEQFALMMLRIAASIGSDPEKLFSSHSHEQENINNICSTPLHEADAETAPLVNTTGKTTSYLQNYPQIFMKKAPDSVQIQNETILNSTQPPNVENVEKSSVDTNKKMENLTSPKITQAASHTDSKTHLKVRYNIQLSTDNHQTTHLKSRSDSHITLEKEKNEEVAREIKQASEEKYNSNESSRHLIHPNSSPTHTASESLERIRKRIKQNAALYHKEQRNEGSQDTDDPTSTQALDKTKPTNK